MYRLSGAEWAYLRKLTRAQLVDLIGYCNKKAIYAEERRDYWLAHSRCAQLVLDAKNRGFQRAQEARGAWLARQEAKIAPYNLVSNTRRRIRRA